MLLSACVHVFRRTRVSGNVPEFVDEKKPAGSASVFVDQFGDPGGVRPDVFARIEEPRFIRVGRLEFAATQKFQPWPEFPFGLGYVDSSVTVTRLREREHVAENAAVEKMNALDSQLDGRVVAGYERDDVWVFGGVGHAALTAGHREELEEEQDLKPEAATKQGRPFPLTALSMSALSKAGGRVAGSFRSDPTFLAHCQAKSSSTGV